MSTEASRTALLGNRLIAGRRTGPRDQPGTRSALGEAREHTVHDGVRGATGLQALRLGELAVGYAHHEVAVDDCRLSLGKGERRSEPSERLVLQRVETGFDGLWRDRGARRDG